MLSADQIVVMVNRGQYEQALGLVVNAPRKSVARAHLKQLHRYAGQDKTREMLNRARVVLMEENWRQKANRLLNINEVEGAVAVLKAKMLRDAEVGARDWHLLGYCLYQLHRYVEAEGYMARAFEMGRSAFHAIWLGNTLERQGKMEAAAAAYDVAVEMRGHETECVLAGNVHFYLKNYDRAIGAFARALKAGCDDPEVVKKMRRLRGIRRRQKWIRLIRDLRFSH